MFWLWLITQGAPSRLQQNSSFAFRNHWEKSSSIFEINYRSAIFSKIFCQISKFNDQNTDILAFGVWLNFTQFLKQFLHNFFHYFHNFCAVLSIVWKSLPNYEMSKCRRSWHTKNRCAKISRRQIMILMIIEAFELSDRSDF